ncbi:hypothetical protein [Campylobacter mucosalis]|uniref:hypothetical protein n=1 Tax=Campylobacter mucosalis TaxID=202 RepID=UPI0020165729|nr:hypothetical protein [Campylobacter mucosalis]
MTKILSILFSIILFTLGLQANLICLKPLTADDTTAPISQSVAATSSSGTYAFSVGIAGDVNGKDIKSNTTQTTSVSSNLNANNIKISTNKDKDTSTNITGSNLIVSNNIKQQHKHKHLKRYNNKRSKPKS